MRKALEIGGVAAAAILVAFGIAAIVMGFNGRSTVRTNLKAEQIVGEPEAACTKMICKYRNIPAKTKRAV